MTPLPNSRQLAALDRNGDVLGVLSTRGRSPDIRRIPEATAERAMARNEIRYTLLLESAFFGGWVEWVFAVPNRYQVGADSLV